ncbi:hypothetical protein [Halostagnicola larsenii]|uniref:hypothetical protein n=1 Tax=Halostagnicola larsenii TaxID=353800 RepID=UPI00146FB451|nr:hypothetical protein [Halostagnicola larsenii]
MSGQPSDPDDRESSALPACPRCGTPVALVTSRGPTEHICSPCGCEVGSPDL